jgi:uroporphyrinogen decarboxylase
VPERWNPIPEPDGAQVVLDEQRRAVARMPAGGYYFEPVNPPLRDATTPREIERHCRLIHNFDWPSFCDEDFADLEARARQLAETTDYALMGNFAVHLFAAGQLLRGYEQFMIDLVARKDLAHCLLERLTDAFVARYDRYHQAVGRHVQIVNVNDDLGMQTGPQLSPALYREMIKPYHVRLYRHIRRTSGVALFLHTDGSVYDLIPDLIDAGVQVLNPVQFTCRNMELRRLKQEFGRELSFWGGGCDTQRVLPHGSAAEVKEHVRQCISVLAPGGGFVFNQVHNIQPDVPPQNVMAMYEAANAWRY